MKNKRAFNIVLTAHGISSFARGISTLAIPWYFTDILHRTSTLGLIYALTTIISLFWGIYVGAIIDRYDRKNIFLVLCSLGIIALGGVAATGYIYGGLSVFLIGFVFTYTRLNNNLHYPTIYAFGQEITTPENYGKINSWLEIVQQSSSMFAGALAAILLSGIDKGSWLSHLFHINIKAWPLYRIFMMDGCAYFVALILVLFIKYKPVKEEEIETGSTWKRLKTGFLFLKEHALILLFGVCSQATFLIILVEEVLILPMYTTNHLHAQGDVYSLATVAYAIGAIFSGFLINRIFRKTNAVKAVILMLVIAALCYFWCAATCSVLVLCIASVLLGLTNAGARIMRSTYLFNNIPNRTIGRTGGVFGFINTFLRTIIILLFSIPFFTLSNNVIYTYFISGVIIVGFIVPLIVKYRKIVAYKVNS